MTGPRDPAGPKVVRLADGGHATTDQLADLLEHTLPSDEAAAVATHTDDCRRCSDVHARLAALPALLAATTVPAMPTGVAARLDQVLADESARRVSRRTADDRAGQHTADDKDTGSVVVSIRRLKRDRVRHWLTGAAAAAAVLVAFTVAPELVPDLSVGGADDASMSAAESGATSGDARSSLAAPESADSLRSTIPAVDAADFADDVVLLAESGAAPFEALVDDSVTATDRRRAGAFAAQSLTRDADCTAAALDAASVAGAPGPLVRFDSELARLVASGPTANRSVAAYSCRSGERLAEARVDLRR